MPIEVAESSLAQDRKVKVPMYARAGIPEVWLVNLPQEVVEVYSDPSAGRYRTVRRVGRSESLPLPGELSGAGAIRVDDVLGGGL